MKCLILGLAWVAAMAGQASTESFERLSTEARQAYEANQPLKAIALYQRALKLRANWPEGWWALGIIHYEANRYSECRDALARMVKLDDKAAPGFALLGLCEFETRQYDASFEHLKRAHMLVPPGKGGHLLDVANYHLALLLIQQGAFEMAQAMMVGVAHNVKDYDPQMLFACGLASLRIPLLPEKVPASDREVVSMAGKALWDLLTKPPEEAKADFEALLAKYPKYPNVHYFYGTYLGAHEPDQSTREFAEELRVNPENVPARVQLALRYVLEGRLDEALKLAREAVRMSPDSVGTNLALGRVLREQGDYQGALEAFLAAKRLDPESPDIRLYLVGAYRAVGRLEDMRREQAEHDRLKAEQTNWP
ncbi:MAG: tetratricopeptide repeat protein [Bryobacteraceae bacterium]